MFMPFFVLDDLKSIDESWPAAKERVETAGTWDAWTLPFRRNTDSMLR